MSENIDLNQKLVTTDQRFGPALKDFEFTVPNDYNHDTQIDNFTNKLKIFNYVSSVLSVREFPKVTNSLKPGKTYHIRIFPILKTVTSEDCMIFLKNHGSIFVGGQGVTLLHEKMPDEFPVGKWVVSFVGRDAPVLRGSIGYYKVPCVRRLCSFDGWSFKSCSLKDFVWDDYYCLLCFCEL